MIVPVFFKLKKCKFEQIFDLEIKKLKNHLESIHHQH